MTHSVRRGELESTHPWHHMARGSLLGALTWDRDHHGFCNDVKEGIWGWGAGRRKEGADYAHHGNTVEKKTQCIKLKTVMYHSCHNIANDVTRDERIKIPPSASESSFNNQNTFYK